MTIALDALFVLSERPHALRLADLARELGMPRSSAHRILAPLVRRGLAEQDSDGRYRAGFALIALGLNVASREPLATAAQPVLESAAAELGETFFLVVARAGKLVVLEKAEGNGFLRAAPRLGAGVPVHVTAVGKLGRNMKDPPAPKLSDSNPSGSANRIGLLFAYA